jgi:transcriptional regulator with XRE-family HTH domain
MTLGERLKEERKRLGLSQPGMAELAGASKNSQISWEKDEASPNARYLMAIAAAGADVQYVLTGIPTRDPYLRLAWQESAKLALAGGDVEGTAHRLIADAYAAQSQSLSEDELELVGFYRFCSTAAKAALFDMARQMRNATVHGHAQPTAGVQQNFHAPITGQVIGGAPGMTVSYTGKVVKARKSRSKS